MKSYSNCPICFATDFTNAISCIDYTVSKSEFQIVECSNCGFHFTNPIPLEKEIGAYYESEDYISHSNKKTGLISRIYQLVRRKTIANKMHLLKSLSKGKNLLDIGSGTGEFLNYCEKRGFNTNGIEPSDQAREYAINEYSLSVYKEEKLNELEESSYDFITMWHVLEHVYKLQDRVKEIHRLLNKSGHVIIAVPNRNSFDANHYKKYWAAYDLPRHLYHFTPKDITKLFEDNGFALKEIIGMKYDSFYVSMLSEKYKNGKGNFINAMWIGLLSNIKAKSKKGITYSSQIYVFCKN